MKQHTKIYLDYFDYPDFVPCEICSKTAIDIHHIDARGMGGDPTGKKDVIENLMALCRGCHLRHGDVKEEVEWLKEIHMKFITK